MSSKRLFYVLCVTLGLLLVATIGVAVGADKLLSSQATKLSQLKADEQVVSDKERILAKNKKDIAKYDSLNAVAQTIVPQDKDQAEAVREIVNLASESGIQRLSSIIFPASTLGTKTPVGAGTGSASGIASTPSSARSSLTQVTPVVGIVGVYDLQITVTQDAASRVPYSQFITFLTKLEQNRRTAQVSNISVQPDVNQPDRVAFTLIIDEFIKP